MKKPSGSFYDHHPGPHSSFHDPLSVSEEDPTLFHPWAYCRMMADYYVPP